MAEESIAVELREGRGKEFNRKLRAAGRVPGVVYGPGRDTVSVTLDPTPLERTLKASHAGMNTLFDLTGESSVAGRTVMVKDLQREPVRGAILHADFYEIDLLQKIDVSVPVHLHGSPPGVLMGGVVEHTLREVELACLPNAIPDELVADVSGLEIGDALHVSDLVLPAGVELLTDPELSIVSVAVPRAEEEAPAEAVEGAEVAAEGEAAPAEGEEKKEPAGEAEDD